MIQPRLRRGVPFLPPLPPPPPPPPLPGRHLRPPIAHTVLSLRAIAMGLGGPWVGRMYGVERQVERYLGNTHTHTYGSTGVWVGQFRRRRKMCGAAGAEERAQSCQLQSAPSRACSRLNQVHFGPDARALLTPDAGLSDKLRLTPNCWISCASCRAARWP